MTFSWPSACAAATRASRPPKSSAEVAAAASTSEAVAPPEQAVSPIAAAAMSETASAERLTVLVFNTGFSSRGRPAAGAVSWQRGYRETDRLERYERSGTRVRREGERRE